MAVTQRHHTSYMDGPALTIEAVGGGLNGAGDNHLKRVTDVRERHPKVLRLAVGSCYRNHQLAHRNFASYAARLSQHPA